MQGNVKYFDSEKGYGFISGEEKDVFVHISQVIGQELHKGDIVTYEMREGKQGKEATNVSVLSFNRE